MHQILRPELFQRIELFNIADGLVARATNGEKVL